MTVQAHAADRRLVVLAVLGVVLALTAAMWTLAGCAPKANPTRISMVIMLTFKAMPRAATLSEP